MYRLASLFSFCCFQLASPSLLGARPGVCSTRAAFARERVVVRAPRHVLEWWDGAARDGNMACCARRGRVALHVYFPYKWMIRKAGKLSRTKTVFTSFACVRCVCARRELYVVAGLTKVVARWLCVVAVLSNRRCCWPS